MGIKKPWIYDSSLPATLAEELKSEGFERPPSPGIRASFEEKQKALEIHSLTASGDLVCEKEYEWPRMSAARASQLRARMRKSQTKGRRSASACLSEDARCRLGLNDYGSTLCLDKAAGAKDGEALRRFSYPTSEFPTFGDKKEDPEPVVINTVDDLLRHLEKIGRLQPMSPFVSGTSRPLSITGSETEVESGDTSFESISSVESEDSISDGGNGAVITEAPKVGPGCDTMRNSQRSFAAKNSP